MPDHLAKPTLASLFCDTYVVTGPHCSYKTRTGKPRCFSA